MTVTKYRKGRPKIEQATGASPVAYGDQTVARCKMAGRGRPKGELAVPPTGLAFANDTIAKYRKLAKTADVGQIDDYYTRATTP